MASQRLDAILKRENKGSFPTRFLVPKENWTAPGRGLTVTMNWWKKKDVCPVAVGVLSKTKGKLAAVLSVLRLDKGKIDPATREVLLDADTYEVLWTASVPPPVPVIEFEHESSSPPPPPPTQEGGKPFRMEFDPESMPSIAEADRFLLQDALIEYHYILTDLWICRSVEKNSSISIPYLLLSDRWRRFLPFQDQICRDFVLMYYLFLSPIPVEEWLEMERIILVHCFPREAGRSRVHALDWLVVMAGGKIKPVYGVDYTFTGDGFVNVRRLTPALIARNHDVKLRDGLAKVAAQKAASSELGDFLRTFADPSRFKFNEDAELSPMALMRAMDEDNPLRKYIEMELDKKVARGTVLSNGATNPIGNMVHLDVRRDVPDIESLVTHFPPCMKRIYTAGRTGEKHLKNDDRRQIITFCRSIGVRDKNEISRIAEARDYDPKDQSDLRQAIAYIERVERREEKVGCFTCKFITENTFHPGNVIHCEFNSTITCGETNGIPEDLRRFLSPAGFVRASLEAKRREQNKGDAMDLID